MSNQKHDSTENQHLDKLLEGVLTELPPENVVVREITPCRKSMNRVLIGLALSMFTLNFLYLNYILPTIGVVLMILGFRSLCRENRGFKACWILSITRALYIFPGLIINASMWQKTILEAPIVKTFNYIHIGVLLLLIICMGFGFSSVQKKAGIKQHIGSIIALFIWYIILCFLGMIQYGGWIIAIALIITYVLIIRSLYKLPYELDEAGYVIVAAPVRISDKTVIFGTSLVLALGLAAAYIFFSKYPMHWTPVAAASKDEAQAVKAHLVSLGFPDTMVDDLTEEDLLDCTDAIRVVVQEQDHSINECTDYKADSPDLHITGVAVELAGNSETWKLFHHFQWNEDVPFYGTEAIQLWPTYREGFEWRMEGTFSGQVLYDDNDQIYAAPYYSLRKITYEQDSSFWASSVSNDTFAEFSFPKGKMHYRGYVSYKILETRDGWFISSMFNYVHQKNWLQYPAQTAMDNIMNPSMLSSDEVFGLMQDQLQFNPNYENF